MGEGTVRDIYRALLISRPRAYTTVLTIMDRLEQKGIVARHKVGRAFRYEARLSAEEARVKAVEKIVEGFFDGSPQALAAHLSSQAAPVPEFSAATPANVEAAATPVPEFPTQNLDERLL
jgi:predicted transcriptional regulator